MKKVLLKIFMLIALLLTVAVNSRCFAITKSREQSAKELYEDFNTITIDENTSKNKNTERVEMPDVPGVTDSKDIGVNETIENTLKNMRIVGIFVVFMIFQIGKMFIL